MKPLAIICQNIIQWYSIYPLVKFLQTNKIPTDILIYNPQTDDSGYHKIATSLQKAIEEKGIRVTKSPNKNGYKVCLAPYSDMISFPCTYHLGYCYGAATTKPSITLLPQFKNGFHGIFLHDTYGAEVYSVYSRTYIVPDLYLEKTEWKPTGAEKPVILFLPTYNEASTIETINALEKLKSKYRIIVKGHHGTDSLLNESSSKKVLKRIADEYYDSSYHINELLKKCDLVLSDNSGAVMDALYAKVPVAISLNRFSPSINGITPLQEILVAKRIILKTPAITSQSLDRIITATLSEQQKAIQSHASDELFPQKKGGAASWYNIIQKYLNDEIDQYYCKLHDFYTNSYNEAKIQTNTLMKNLSLIEKENATLLKQLDHYRRSRAHSILDKILQRRHAKQQGKEQQ